MNPSLATLDVNKQHAGCAQCAAGDTVHVHMYDKIAAVDFDGTVAQYHGWTGPDVKTEPIAGAFQAIEMLVTEGYKVVIFSSRPKDSIIAWLTQHDMMRLVSNVTDQKPIATVIFDDRAFCSECRASAVPTNKPYALLMGVIHYLAKGWQVP